MRKKVLICIEVILVIVILVSGYKVVSKIYKYRTDERTYNDLINKYKIQGLENKSSGSKDANKINTVYKSSFDKLRVKNPDYRFWISVENTNIDFPVVQGSDNKYYLKHDFNKDESISGCPFVNCNNNFKTDKNVIVYGHNMRNNNMFNQLEKFKNKNFFNANNKIIVTDEEGEHTYEVFSVYTMKSNDEIGKTNYINKNDFLNQVKKMESRSFYKKNISIDDNDKILTLVTCTYEINDGRLVVEAKSVS